MLFILQKLFMGLINSPFSISRHWPYQVTNMLSVVLEPVDMVHGRLIHLQEDCLLLKNKTNKTVYC